MCVLSCSFMSDSATLRTVVRQAPLSMEFSGKNTGAGCHSLLQGIFLTQGLNLCLLGLLYCGRFFTVALAGKPHMCVCVCVCVCVYRFTRESLKIHIVIISGKK